VTDKRYNSRQSGELPETLLQKTISKARSDDGFQQDRALRAGITNHNSELTCEAIFNKHPPTPPPVS